MTHEVYFEVDVTKLLQYTNIYQTTKLSLLNLPLGKLYGLPVTVLYRCPALEQGRISMLPPHIQTCKHNALISITSTIHIKLIALIFTMYTHTPKAVWLIDSPDFGYEPELGIILLKIE